jgi:hypothetical protein
MAGLSPWNPQPGQWVCPSCSAFNDPEAEKCWACGLYVPVGGPPEIEKKPPAPSVRRGRLREKRKGTR